MQIKKVTIGTFIKQSLTCLILVSLAGCCGSTDSFARLTDEEIEYIPFTDVEHVDFVDESGEVHTGTYSGRILEELNLQAADQCNAKIKELLYSDLEIPSKEQIFYIYVESRFNVRSDLSEPAFFRVVNGNNFPVVKNCGTRGELNISDYETSYSFNDRVLEDVLVLGSCRPSSDIAVIIYSGTVGIVLVEFQDGSYLMNKEVNDL